MKPPQGISYILITIVSIWLASCSSDNSSDSQLDSSQIIEAGVAYLYKNRTFAPEAYTMAIRIIDSPNVPKGLNFIMNGKNCEIVARPPDTEYYKNFRNPIPYIDVTKLTLMDGGTINLQLSFPSTGTEYFLRVKKDTCGKFQVDLITYSKT